MLKRILFLPLAMFLCVLIMISVPALNELIRGEGDAEKKIRVVAQVEVVKVVQPKDPPKPRKQIKQPNTPKPIKTVMRGGPRFAMDLGVASLGGASVPLDIAQGRRGGGGPIGPASDEGVDERPSPSFPVAFRVPPEVKAAEQDALLILSFCVDVSGKPYDIQIKEERPRGKGMAQAGMEALRQTTFNPAKKGGSNVPFCGLEQPFEIKFSD